MEIGQSTETGNNQMHHNVIPSQTNQVLHHQGKMTKLILLMKKLRK